MDVSPSGVSSSRKVKRHVLGAGCNQDVFVGIVLQTDKTIETIHEIKDDFVSILYVINKLVYLYVCFGMSFGV